MLNIQLFALRFRLGLLDTESLVRAADTLLEEGHTEPAVIELSILELPIMAEAAPLFEKACAQLGVAIPTKDKAINKLLHFHLETIASKAVAPHEGLSAIMRELYFPHLVSEPCKEYVGDSRGMEHLIGPYWAYDDLTDCSRGCSWDGKFSAEAIASWEQSVRQYAGDWLEKYDHFPMA
jgi:hypothetical protein